MNRTFSLGFLPVISLVGALTIQAGALYDNGPPDRTNGFEMTHWIEADDFTLDAPARLENVKFWNFESSGSFEGSIVWQIYSNAEVPPNSACCPADIPGTLLFSGTSTNLTHVATGFIFFGYAEFITTFDITPVSLPAGTYWLALHNGPLTNDTSLGRVFWETTSNVGARESLSRVSPFLGPWFSNSVPPGSPSDLAFQLNGVVGPSITAFAFNEDVPKIRFTTTADQNYRVDYKNSLADASWTTVSGAEMVFGTGGVVEVGDPDLKVATLPQRFYRVELL